MRLADIDTVKLAEILPELEAERRFADLWELVKASSVQSGVRILTSLRREGWSPKDDKPAFEMLSSIAGSCQRVPSPFQKLAFRPVEYEELITASSFVYSEREQLLVTTDMHTSGPRLRWWSTVDGTLVTSTSFMTAEEEIYLLDPLQMISTADLSLSLVIHLGGKLSIWRRDGTVSNVPLLDGGSANIAASPFAIVDETRFVVCGYGGNLLLTDGSNTRTLAIANRGDAVVSIVTGDRPGTLYALDSERQIHSVDVQAESASVLTKVEKRGSFLFHDGHNACLLVGTHRGELLRVSTTGRDVSSVFDSTNLGAVSSIDSFYDGSVLLISHASGFYLRDRDSLEPLVWIPRNLALPTKAAGSVTQVTGDREHAIHIDYSKTIRLFDLRAATVDIVFPASRAFRS